MPDYLSGEVGALPGRESAVAGGRLWIPKRLSKVAIWQSTWAIPLALGFCYWVAAVLLVIIEFGQPPQSDALRAIRFSNAINSPGARHIVALYRDRLGWIADLYARGPLTPSPYVWGICIAWIGMVAIQIVSLVMCRRMRAERPLPWLIGPVVACLILLFYPPTSTDIYAYSSFGWVWEHGGNPYLQTPKSMGGDPYAPFNDWTHVRTPYGPIWTGISRLLDHLGNDDPFVTAFGYKIVSTIAGFGLAAVTYHIAKRLTNDRHLALFAMVLVLWSPILITEATATMHLDPVVMVLAMSGLAIATGTRFKSQRLGLALVVFSALVKPVTLPLIALMIVMRIAAPDRTWIVAKRIALDVAMTLGIIALGYAPFWHRDLPGAMVDNARILYIDAPLRSNPLWVWGFAHIDTEIGFSDRFHLKSGSATRYITMAAAAVVAIFLIKALLKQRKLAIGQDALTQDRALLKFMILSWAAVMVVIGILPVNAHPWYAIWPMALLALLWVSDGIKARAANRPPLWLLGLNTWILLSFVVYHTLPRHR